MEQHTLSFTQCATGGGGGGRHYSRVAWLNPGGHESPGLPYEGQGRLLGGADGLQAEKKRKDFLCRWKNGFLGDLSGQEQEQKYKKELVWRGWILHLANSF